MKPVRLKSFTPSSLFTPPRQNSYHLGFCFTFLIGFSVVTSAPKTYGFIFCKNAQNSKPIVEFEQSYLPEQTIDRSYIREKVRISLPPKSSIVHSQVSEINSTKFIQIGYTTGDAQTSAFIKEKIFINEPLNRLSFDNTDKSIQTDQGRQLPVKVPEQHSIFTAKNKGNSIDIFLGTVADHYTTVLKLVLVKQESTNGAVGSRKSFNLEIDKPFGFELIRPNTLSPERFEVVLYNFRTKQILIKRFDWTSGIIRELVDQQSLRSVSELPQDERNLYFALTIK